MPTKAECVGMSFIEAIYLGLPAVGTEIEGFLKLLRMRKLVDHSKINRKG